MYALTLTLTHSDAHMRTRGEAGRAGGPFWALEHQHLAPSTSGTLVGKLRPMHRCEFVTAGEQGADPESSLPAHWSCSPLFILEGISLDLQIF